MFAKSRVMDKNKAVLLPVLDRVRKYMNALLLVLGLFLSMDTYSQTIINAEKLNSANDSLAFSLELTYSGNRGNVVTDKFELAPSFLLVGKKNDFKLFGGYSILTTSTKSHLNNGFAHIRHNYKLSARLKTFEFYQIQFNAVLLLHRREVLGAGLRYALVQKDSVSFDMGLGAMHESEFLDSESLEVGEITNTFVMRGAIVSSFEWIMNDFIQINNVIYYQPSLKNFEDFRLLNDFSLTTQITDRFNITTSWTIRYDSKPPLALTNFDSKMNVGLGYKLSK